MINILITLIAIISIIAFTFFCREGMINDPLENMINIFSIIGYFVFIAALSLVNYILLFTGKEQ